MMDKTKNRLMGVLYALVLPVTSIVTLVYMLGVAVYYKVKRGYNIKDTMMSVVHGSKAAVKAIWCAIVKGEVKLSL